MGSMKRILILIIISVLTVVLLTGCGVKSIEIPLFDGTIVEVETKGLSKEQVQSLEQVAEGELNLRLLLQDGLFTEKELDEIGIMPANKLPAASDRGAMNTDLTEIDINDLNLEGLTDIQIEAVEQAIAGEKTLQSMMSEGLFTQDELRAIGLIGTDGLGGQGQGSKGGGGN